MKRVLNSLLALTILFGCSSNQTVIDEANNSTQEAQNTSETMKQSIDDDSKEIAINTNDEQNVESYEVPAIFSYNQNGEIVGSVPEITIEDNLAYNKEENVVYVNKDLTNEQTAVDYFLSLLHITAKDEEDGDLFPTCGYIKEENSYIIAVGDKDGNNTQMIIPVIKADPPKPVVDESTYTYDVIVTDSMPTKKVVNEFKTVNITLPSGYEFLQPVLDSYGITKEYEDGVFTIYEPNVVTFKNYSYADYTGDISSISYRKADEETIDTLYPQDEIWTRNLIGDPNKPIWNYDRNVTFSSQDKKEIFDSVKSEKLYLEHADYDNFLNYETCTFDGQIIACSLTITKEKYPNINFQIPNGNTYLKREVYTIIDFSSNTSLFVEYNEYDSNNYPKELNSSYFDANSCMQIIRDDVAVLGIANYKGRSSISYHMYTGSAGWTQTSGGPLNDLLKQKAQSNYSAAK